MRFWRHLRALWPGLGILLPVPFVIHAIWALSQHRFHWENAAVLGLSLSLFSIGPRTKKLFIGADTFPAAVVFEPTSVRPTDDNCFHFVRAHDSDRKRYDLACT